MFWTRIRPVLGYVKALLDLPRYLPLIIRTKLARPSLARRNEESLVSDQVTQVNQVRQELMNNQKKLEDQFNACGS